MYRLLLSCHLVVDFGTNQLWHFGILEWKALILIFPKHSWSWGKLCLILFYSNLKIFISSIRSASQLYLLEIQAQLQKELDPNVRGGSGLLHMVCLVRNYTYTTTKNEGKVVQKKSSKDEKRGLSSFNLVQIQVGRIMKQQTFFGKKNFGWLQSRIISRRSVAGCPIDIGQNSTCPNT